MKVFHEEYFHRIGKNIDAESTFLGLAIFRERKSVTYLFTFKKSATFTDDDIFYGIMMKYNGHFNTDILRLCVRWHTIKWYTNMSSNKSPIANIDHTYKLPKGIQQIKTLYINTYPDT